MEIIDKLYLQISKINKIETIIFNIVVALLILWSLNYIVNTYFNKALLIQGQILIFYGLVVWFLIFCFFILSLFRIIILTLEKQYAKNSIIHWISYIVLVSIIYYFFNGYKIANIGFTSLFNNLEYTSRQAHYLLIKLYPENIITSIYTIFISIFNVKFDLYLYNEFLVSFYTLFMMIFIVFIVTITSAIKSKFSKKIKFVQYIISITSFLILIYFSYLKYYDLIIQSQILSTIFIGQLTLNFIFLFEIIIFYNLYRQNVSKDAQLINTKRIIFIFLILLPMLSLFQSKYSYEQKVQHLIRQSQKKNIMTVTAETLNIRESFNKESKIVGNLKKGQMVEVIEIKNNWAKIGSKKWVSKKYLK